MKKASGTSRSSATKAACSRFVRIAPPPSAPTQPQSWIQKIQKNPVRCASPNLSVPATLRVAALLGPLPLSLPRPLVVVVRGAAALVDAHCPPGRQPGLRVLRIPVPGGVALAPPAPVRVAGIALPGAPHPAREDGGVGVVVVQPHLRRPRGGRTAIKWRSCSGWRVASGSWRSSHTWSPSARTMRSQACMHSHHDTRAFTPGLRRRGPCAPRWAGHSKAPSATRTRTGRATWWPPCRKTGGSPCRQVRRRRCTAAVRP